MENYQLNVIDSTYSVKDAKEVMLTLINDKIKFLTLKIFSQRERSGNINPHLEKRVNELKNEQNRLIEMLNAYQDDQVLVEIDCKINYAVKKVDKV